MLKRADRVEFARLYNGIIINQLNLTIVRREHGYANEVCISQRNNQFERRLAATRATSSVNIY